jgi:hypothetical protein
LLTLPVYPTSSSREIMSSTSNCFILSFAPPLTDESAWGVLLGAEPGVNGVELERMV